MEKAIHEVTRTCTKEVSLSRSEFVLVSVDSWIVGFVLQAGGTTFIVKANCHIQLACVRFCTRSRELWTPHWASLPLKSLRNQANLFFDTSQSRQVLRHSLAMPFQCSPTNDIKVVANRICKPKPELTELEIVPLVLQRSFYARLALHVVLCATLVFSVPRW
jgi:hypothetical protein